MMRYRFGFNGQEKSDEIVGTGNHNTALFWEYDTRLGRRWNLDPKPNVSISSYATFANNPIWFSDPLGDTLGFATHDDFQNVLAGSIFSSEFAKNVNILRKSTDTYTYNNTCAEVGEVGSVEKISENKFIINYTTESIGQDNQEGQSPYHSMFEETYHAVDYSSGVPGVLFKPGNKIMQTTNPQDFESRAWKWTAMNAPFSRESVTLNHPQAGQLTTTSPLIKQMKSASLKEISNMLFNGYKIPVVSPDGKKGNLKFGPKYDDRLSE